MVLGANVVANGDAELDRPCSSDGWSCGADQQPRCWSGSGCCAVCYNVTDDYPSSSTQGPADRGEAFFRAGRSANCTMQQSKILPPALADLAASGELLYNFSAYLGGWRDQNDTFTASVQFVSRSGAVLGADDLAAVSAKDRGNATALILRSASGPAPNGTYAVCVQLMASRQGAQNNNTDGYSDSLSLVHARWGDRANGPRRGSAACKCSSALATIGRRWGFGGPCATRGLRYLS
jgi:hypothetical protein